MDRRTLLSFLGAPLALSYLTGCSSADRATLEPDEAPHASVTSAVTTATIDSPAEGEKLPAGIVRVSGHFTDAYNVNLSIAGKDVERVHTVTDGEESGTWYYDLDTRQLDGPFQMSVQAGVWSPWRNVSVDNPAANVPKVTIAGPADGATVRARTPVHMNIEARNDIASVSVRINGGAWLPASVASGGGYEYAWDPTPLGNAMASIEARAVDARGNVGISFTTYVRVGDGAATRVHVVRQDRAMWLWEPGSYSLIHNPGSRRVLEDFAADGKVKTIYFGVDRYAGENMLEDHRPEVRAFVAWAHAAGLQVYALIASAARPDYLGAIEPYQGYAIREYEKVLNYDLSSNPRERFDGLNVDLEPYQWGNYDTPIQLQWLDVLEHMMQRRDAAGSGHAFGPAIPFWLDGTTVTWKGQTKPLNEHMQDLNDYVAIMSYRDSADGMVAAAQNDLTYAAKIGKPALVGLESTEISSTDGDPWWISYHHVGRTYMEKEVAKVYASVGSNPGFGGIVMEHYDALIDLPSDWSRNPSYPPHPTDERPPSAVSGRLAAATFDFQTVNLTWGRAYDDTTVDVYNVYRSEDPNFRPCPENLVGTTKDLWLSDIGLLPSTRYYYRVSAVDISGKEGPVSAPTSAKTAPPSSPSSPLRPMIVDKIELGPGANPDTATVRVRVIDKATGAPVTANVHGHFTKRGGLFLDMAPTDQNGWTEGTSETFTLPNGIVGFTPQRIVAKGYYWAGAYDRTHYVETDLSSAPLPEARMQSAPILVAKGD